jgi:tetratricopeptide (TPR) repeat protein
LGSQSQIHDFARGLEAQGHQDEALELFQSNVKKDPHTWIAHNEAARIAVAKGDFDTALKEMKLAMAESPAALKSQHADLVRRLENKEDINR